MRYNCNVFYFSLTTVNFDSLMKIIIKVSLIIMKINLILFINYEMKYFIYIKLI